MVVSDSGSPGRRTAHHKDLKHRPAAARLARFVPGDAVAVGIDVEIAAGHRGPLPVRVGVPSHVHAAETFKIFAGPRHSLISLNRGGHTLLPAAGPFVHHPSPPADPPVPGHSPANLDPDS